MQQEEITRIKVGNHVVGIWGLKTVLENLADSIKGKRENEIRDILVRELGKKNYIPEPVKGDYGEAFLREYKKFVGESAVESGENNTGIKVIGPGCVQCNKLERRVMEVLSELRLMEAVEHVRDPLEIGKMGITSTPALVIGDKVVVVGSVPPKSKMKEYIVKYLLEKQKA